jgi:hypothetical protein
LPLFVTLLFRGMPGMWKHRHRLLLCWLVVMQALFPGRKRWPSWLAGHPLQTAPKHALRYCGNKTTVFLRVQKSFYSLKASICRLNIQKAV